MAQKKNNKLNIFLDANALQHLSSIELNTGKERKVKANKWLWDSFNVFTCKKVKDEFMDAPDSLGENIRATKRKLTRDTKLIPSSNYVNHLEKNWLAVNFYHGPLSKRDEGERQLICLAIENVKTKKLPQVVIVSDDLTARRNFMEDVKDNFPFGELWTSLDLVVYLYFVKKEFNFENAKDAIRDIVSKKSFPWKWSKFKLKGYREEDVRILINKHYSKKINNLSKIKSTINN